MSRFDDSQATCRNAHNPASLLLLVAMALTLVACASPGTAPTAESSASQPHIGVRKITAGIPSNPPFVYNALNVGGVGGQGGQLQRLTHRGLASSDPLGNLHPVLANEVPTLTNGLWNLLADGKMQTTWKIRSDALWQDGQPFTAEDLVFSFRIFQDKGLPGISTNINYARIERVEAENPSTIIVHWKEPYIDADGMFGSIGLPIAKHLMERPYLEQSPEAFLDSPYWNAEFVGTGPFRVKEMVRGSHLLVEAFDRFVLGRPKIDQVEVRFLNDETVLMANILSGIVELTLARALSAEQGQQLQEQWKDGHIDLKMDDWYVLYPQHVNPNPSVITNASFRKGLLSGTDRQGMADTLEGRLSQVSESVVGPNDAEYNAIQVSVVHYPYDPRRAAQLFEEAGLRKGADGIYRDSSDHAIQIEINCTALDAHQRLLFTLVDAWPKLGVGVEPLVIPPQRSQDAEYRATFPGMALQGHPNDISMYHSSQARLPERNYFGSNNARYMNPQLDALIDRYYSTIPKDERTRILGNIVAHMTDQLPVIPLIWRVDPTAIGNRVMNVSGSGSGDQAWNAHEWDLRS